MQIAVGSSYIPTLCSCDTVWKEAAFFLFSFPTGFVSEAKRKKLYLEVFYGLEKNCGIFQTDSVVYLPESELT